VVRTNDLLNTVVEFSIFDRFCKIVFFQPSANNGWNGN